MPKISLPANQSEIGKGVEFIEQTIRKYHFKNKEVLKTLLVAEENMVRLIDRAEADAQMQISIRYRYGTAEITISTVGEPLDANEPLIDLSISDMGHCSEETIRSILLQAFSDKITYTRKGEYNFIRIISGMKEPVFLLRTLAALTSGLAVGILLLLFVPRSTVTVLANQLLFPIQTVYLNALQLITAPTVFFCLLSNVAKYISFSDPGRINRRVVIGCLMTSVLAVLIGMFVFNSYQPLIHTEDFLVPYIGYKLINIGPGNSILDMIIDIVPKNIVAPFYDTNAMQLLLLALLGGVALGSTGQYSSKLREAVDALNSFFSQITNIISNLIPIATFFSTILCVAYFELESLFIPADVFFMAMLGFIGMILCYCMLMLVCSLNPITFLRKFAPHTINTFLNSSGISVISETMQMCEKDFGVSPKVFTFSIPFGAIANLDGYCVYLTIVGMYFAKLCGAEFLEGNLVTIVFTVVLLSVGAPIAPGSVTVTLAMLLNTMGVSPMGICFIIGVNVILEMVFAVCNTIGDVAITLIVAKTGGLLDMKVYRAKPVKKGKKGITI